MNPVVFIQAGADGEPYSTNGAAAERGFRYLGFETVRFPKSDLPSLPLTAQTVVVGGTATVLEAFRQVGARVPSHISAPAVLHPFLVRPSWRTTAAELRAANRFPVCARWREITGG